jgi:hypothetical protein
MSKKTKSDLTHSESLLNKWTPSRRKTEEEKYMGPLPTDPDEDTIYNVICPLIRAGWSEGEERLRRVQHSPRVHTQRCSVAIDHKVYYTSPAE